MNEYGGKEIIIDVNGDGVGIKEADGHEKGELVGRLKETKRAGIALPEAKITERLICKPAEYTLDTVGNKALRLSRIKHGDILSKHIALGFSFYEAVLNLAENKDKKERIDELGEELKTTDEGDIPNLLTLLRKEIRSLEMPEELVEQVNQAIKENIGDGLVFLRSSTNAEDLTFYSGAGLYDSFGAVDSSNLSTLSAKIKMVWASVWGERAYFDRRENGLEHDKVKIAVLIQEMMPAEYSFVVHTRNPCNGNKNELIIEIVQGLGETLVSGDYEGQPHRYLYYKDTGKLEKLACANKDYKVVLDEEMIIEQLVDYSKDIFAIDSIIGQKITRQIVEFSIEIEQDFGKEQDIEGCIIKVEDEPRLTFVQSRDQQYENRNMEEERKNDGPGPKASNKLDNLLGILPQDKADDLGGGRARSTNSGGSPHYAVFDYAARSANIDGGRVLFGTPLGRIGSLNANMPNSMRYHHRDMGAPARKHFNNDGVAIDKEGEEAAIKQYQAAINRIVVWAKTKDIPISNVEVFGSFAKFKKKLPRLGIWDSAADDIAERLKRKLHHGGPSDIDIAISISRKGTDTSDLNNNFREFKNGIFREIGVWIECWFEAPPSWSTVPISELAGEGLINAYRQMYNLTERTSQNSSGEESPSVQSEAAKAKVAGFYFEGKLVQPRPKILKYSFRSGFYYCLSFYIGGEYVGKVDVNVYEKEMDVYSCGGLEVVSALRERGFDFEILPRAFVWAAQEARLQGLRPSKWVSVYYTIDEEQYARAIDCLVPLIALLRGLGFKDYLEEYQADKIEDEDLINLMRNHTRRDKTLSGTYYNKLDNLRKILSTIGPFPPSAIKKSGRTSKSNGGCFWKLPVGFPIPAGAEWGECVWRFARQTAIDAANSRWCVDDGEFGRGMVASVRRCLMWRVPLMCGYRGNGEMSGNAIVGLGKRLFSGKKGYNLFNIIKYYDEMFEDSLSTQKVKPYAKTRGEGYWGLEGDISNFNGQKMKEYWDEASITNRGEAFFALTIIYPQKFSVLDREDGIKCASVYVCVNSEPPFRPFKFVGNDGTRDVFVAFVGEFYRTIRAHRKSWGWGTRIPIITTSGCSAFALSLNWRGESPRYNSPSATIIYSPAYLSTSSSRCSFSHLSASNRLDDFFLAFLDISSSSAFSAITIPSSGGNVNRIKQTDKDVVQRKQDTDLHTNGTVSSGSTECLSAFAFLGLGMGEVMGLPDVNWVAVGLYWRGIVGLVVLSVVAVEICIIIKSWRRALSIRRKFVPYKELPFGLSTEIAAIAEEGKSPIIQARPANLKTEGYNRRLGRRIAEKYLSGKELQEKLKHSRLVANIACNITRQIKKNNHSLWYLSPEFVRFLAWTHDTGYCVDGAQHELHTIDILVHKEGIPQEVAAMTMHGQLPEQFGKTAEDIEQYMPVGLEGVILVYADLVANVRSRLISCALPGIFEICNRVQRRSDLDSILRLSIISFLEKANFRFGKYELIILFYLQTLHNPMQADGKPLSLSVPKKTRRVGKHSSPTKPFSTRFAFLPGAITNEMVWKYPAYAGLSQARLDAQLGSDCDFGLGSSVHWHHLPGGGGGAFGKNEQLQLLDSRIYVDALEDPVHPSVDGRCYYERRTLMALLRHSAKDAKGVNDMAIDFSRRTRRPVLLIICARTGCLCTPAIDNWWIQLKKPQLKDKFYKQVKKLIQKRHIARKKAEFIVAQEWLKKRKIDWYVDVIVHCLPSVPDAKSLHRASGHSDFLDQWRRIFESTDINLMFVDDTALRQSDRLGLDVNDKLRFAHPLSFTRIREYIIEQIYWPRQQEKIYYLNVGESEQIQYSPDAPSIIFYRPVRCLPKYLRGRFPLASSILINANEDNLAYAWWADIADIVGLAKYELDSDRYSYSLTFKQISTVKTNFGRIPLSIFVVLKIKELTGWFERNSIDLLEQMALLLKSEGYTDAVALVQKRPFLKSIGEVSETQSGKCTRGSDENE